MDEELGGVNPNSFFEQLTEVRGVAETAQKTSNSNLSLLNELREKVEIISNDLRMLKGETDAAKDKAFEEEDKKQKEEMKAKVESQNEKTQGGSLGEGGGEQGESKPTGTKGGGGGVMGFFSALIGGLVGGTVGLAIQGVGRILDFGSKAINGAKKLGENLAKGFAGLFGKKKEKGEGEAKPVVSPDKLLNANFDDDDDKDYEKNRKKNLDLKKEVKKELEDDLGVGDKEKNKRGSGKDLKDEIKDELKEELGLGDKLKETGKNILGGIKKTFGGIKDTISNFDGRPGSRDTKYEGVKSESEKEVIKKEESFSMPKGKETSFADALSGNRNIIHQFLFEKRIKSIPPGEGFNDFSGNPAYDSDVDTFLRGLKDSPQGYGIEIHSGRVFLSKEKSKDGGYAFGRDTKYEGVKSDIEMYGDTFPKGSFSAPKKNTYERAILEFNEGGIVQKFNQGGEVDSVPAMLTPGEFVVTKDAVEKVGADTLKGLNASVGATNKASNLGSFEIKRLDAGDLSKDALVKKSSFMNNVEDIEISNESGGNYFRSITDMSTGGLNETTVERTRFTETSEDGTVTVFDQNIAMTEKIASIGVPDLIEHQDQLLGEIHKLKGFENVTIDQVINSTTGIPQEKLLPILIKSDAQKATDEKERKATEEDRVSRGIKPGQGFSMSANDEIGRSLAGTMGYRIGQIRPDMLVSAMTNLREETKVASKTGVKPKIDPLFIDPLFDDLSASINASVKGYNEGGLVGSSITPIIESKNENGEMKRIDSISQSVDANRQTIQLIEEQNQAMSPPNQNPSPLAPADTPQTSPAEIKDTDAPIPFAMLLRQNAQRYLNLGNDAMVIS